jgi:NAD(P)-dependent dehydrogenase (short-subunit alcohol dehydrogenase family)
MDLELKGKTAIVTGGSRGIGKAVARELAREGVAVAIVARGLEALQAAAADLESETGGRIAPISVDTASDESVRHMVAEALSHLGRIDILVNCAATPAGGSPPPKLAQITDDAFFSEMNTKVMGYLRCIREVAPHMIENGWGRIISISGLAARQANAAIGSMRNVAVSAMTKNFADELGPHGIGVVVVHPGMTYTERAPELISRMAAAQGISEDEAKKRIFQRNVQGRVIDARDIASVVTFLASPRAMAINGDAVVAGGGSPTAIYY